MICFQNEPIDWSEYWDPKLYVVNNLGEPQSHAERLAARNENKETMVYDIRRVRGVFLENLELEDFPFDVQVNWLTLTQKFAGDNQK